MKLLKVIKNLFIIVCIFSFSISTYADVDFSDEDSFVTKNELDAILNDYNNRLTVFEAGINTKIDLQVTSYLDRYGIWTKQEQNFQGNDKRRVILPALGDGVDEADVIHVGNFNKPRQGYDINLSSHYLGVCEKSGLCFLELAFIPEEIKKVDQRKIEASWSVVTTNHYSDNSIFLTADIVKIDNSKINVKQLELDSLDKFTTIDSTSLVNDDVTLKYVRNENGIMTSYPLYTYITNKKDYDKDLVARVYISKPYVGPITYNTVSIVATAGRYPTENERFLNKFFVQKGDILIIATRVAGGVYSDAVVDVYVKSYAGLDFELKSVEVY